MILSYGEINYKTIVFFFSFNIEQPKSSIIGECLNQV